MLSTVLIKALLLSYIIIMIVCLYEKNLPKAMYWLGASILQISIYYGVSNNLGGTNERRARIGTKGY